MEFEKVFHQVDLDHDGIINITDLQIYCDEENLNPNFVQVVNVGCMQAEERILLTGLHFVADIYCACCSTTLGWKYERAFEASQRYKEGKYIIEMAHLIKDNGWDTGDQLAATGTGTGAALLSPTTATPKPTNPSRPSVLDAAMGGGGDTEPPSRGGMSPVELVVPESVMSASYHSHHHRQSPSPARSSAESGGARATGSDQRPGPSPSHRQSGQPQQQQGESSRGHSSSRHQPRRHHQHSNRSAGHHHHHHHSHAHSQHAPHHQVQIGADQQPPQRSHHARRHQQQRQEPRDDVIPGEIVIS